MVIFSNFNKLITYKVPEIKPKLSPGDPTVTATEDKKNRVNLCDKVVKHRLVYKGG